VDVHELNEQILDTVLLQLAFECGTGHSGHSELNDVSGTRVCVWDQRDCRV
jgi:hypothetical protein